MKILQIYVLMPYGVLGNNAGIHINGPLQSEEEFVLLLKFY